MEYNNKKNKSASASNAKKPHPAHHDNKDKYNAPKAAQRQMAQEQDLAEMEDSGLVIGRNAVRELLKSDRAIDKIFVQRGEREGSIVVIVAEAVEKKILHCDKFAGITYNSATYTYLTVDREGDTSVMTISSVRSDNSEAFDTLIIKK